jgi:hypothetical protein
MDRGPPPRLSFLKRRYQNETRGWCRRAAMTIQEAINKAIEGGYPKERIEDLSEAYPIVKTKKSEN